MSVKDARAGVKRRGAIVHEMGFAGKHLGYAIQCFDSSRSLAALYRVAGAVMRAPNNTVLTVRYDGTDAWAGSIGGHEST